MQTYDFIVVGNGLAGAALSYELAKAKQSVLLMDDGSPDSGTRYSYGGVGYWAGTSELTTTLLEAGLARHQALPDELGAPTQFREIDLLLTVEKGADVESLKQDYKIFSQPPVYISPQAAREIEPQLALDSIEGAFSVCHGHVNPMLLVAAYNQAFRRLGGHHNISAVTGVVKVGNRVTGVMTEAQAYPAGNVIISAGAYSLRLLEQAQLQIPLLFTHAEIVETPPLDVALSAIILPAENNRFNQEMRAAGSALWQAPNTQVAAPVLEAGVVQFVDGTTRIGQISRFHTAYTPPEDSETSALTMRSAITQKIPALKDAPGQWRHCLVTFTADGLPLIGAIPDVENLHVFSGFTGPFAMVPPVAQRYAQHLTQSSDQLIKQLLIQRFSD
ncbi:MAG: FAD-binding oxidoreductase [Cyanobacteria bacterium P01_D01_bin.105]